MKKLSAIVIISVILSITSAAFIPAVSAVEIEYGIWANSTSESKAIQWSGSKNEVHGNVHTNNDFKMSGSSNIINGTLEYVSSYTVSGSSNTYLNVAQVSPEPFPAQYNIEDYKPGGTEAIAAGSNYHHYADDFHISDSDVVLETGLYYVKGDVHLSGSNIRGVFTIVAEGNIHVSGSGHNYSAYSGGLLFLSNATSQEWNIKLSGSENCLGGIIYAPKGEIRTSGSRNTINGCLLGDTVQLSGSGNTVNALPMSPTPPVADFSFTPTEPYAGEKVIFDASASYVDSGYIVLYTWDFDDGNTESVTSETVTHAFDKEGDYTVTLIVKDDEGEEATATKEIEVLENMLPVASFSVSNETPATNQSIKFDASESYDPDGNIEVYRWDFDGNGIWDSEENFVTINHSYNEEGDTTIILEVEDNKRATDLTTITVTVNGEEGEETSGNVTLDDVSLTVPEDERHIIGEPIEITGSATLNNTGDATSVTIEICVDGCIIYQEDTPLLPGVDAIPVSVEWLPMSSGAHYISLQVRERVGDEYYWIGPTNDLSAEIWVFIKKLS